MVTFPTKENPDILFQNIYILDQSSKSLERTAYSVFALIGDLGGVFLLFTDMVGMIF